MPTKLLFQQGLEGVAPQKLLFKQGLDIGLQAAKDAGASDSIFISQPFAIQKNIEQENARRAELEKAAQTSTARSTSAFFFPELGRIAKETASGTIGFKALGNIAKGARATSQLLITPFAAMATSKKLGVTPREVANASIDTAWKMLTDPNVKSDQGVAEVAQAHLKNRGIGKYGENKANLTDIGVLAMFGFFDLLGDPAFFLPIVEGIKVLKEFAIFKKVGTVTKKLPSGVTLTPGRAFDIPIGEGLKVKVKPQTSEVIFEGYKKRFLKLKTEPLEPGLPSPDDITALTKEISNTTGVDIKTTIKGDDVILKAILGQEARLITQPITKAIPSRLLNAGQEIVIKNKNGEVMETGIIDKIAPNGLIIKNSISNLPTLYKDERFNFELKSEPKINFFHGSADGQLKLDKFGNINLGKTAADVERFGQPVPIDTTNLVIRDVGTKEELFKIAENKEAELARGTDIIVAKNHGIAINPARIQEITKLEFRPDELNKSIEDIQKNVEPITREITQVEIKEQLKDKIIPNAVRQALEGTEKNIEISRTETIEGKPKVITASEFFNRLAKLNPEFKANPVLVTEDGNLIHKSSLGTTKINPEILGLKGIDLPNGIEIKITPAKKLTGEVKADIKMAKFAEDIEKKFTDCN